MTESERPRRSYNRGAHARVPRAVTLTEGELFLARMLVREGLSDVGMVALFADRQAVQVRLSKQHTQRYKAKRRALRQARKAAGLVLSRAKPKAPTEPSAED